VQKPKRLARVSKYNLKRKLKTGGHKQSTEVNQQESVPEEERIPFAFEHNTNPAQEPPKEVNQTAGSFSSRKSARLNNVTHTSSSQQHVSLAMSRKSL